jgi:2-polyprenyl-3-methyl-5-hydroxy-6-metoxy-1,4-benzoquinol methylase
MERIDYTRHYRRWHDDSVAHLEKMSAFYEKLITPHLFSDKTISILDIGCGMGFLLKGLQNAGYLNIKGIEIDENQVLSCKKKGLDVELVSDSTAYLSKNTDSFDVITVFDVLEHIPPADQISFIKAIYCSLNPGGVLMVSVPNANSFLASRNRYIDYTHHVLFTEASLDFVIYNGGFQDIKILPMDYYKFRISITSLIHFALYKTIRLFRRIAMIAELGIKQGVHVPLSFNLIGKAIKKI